jgi:hypothetical protein
MEFKNFILNFVNTTKQNIIELAKTELNNNNKKMVLDQRIIEFLDNTIAGVKLNFILKLALKKLLLPNVSIITQIVFDLLKARIEGITK